MEFLRVGQRAMLRQLLRNTRSTRASTPQEAHAHLLIQPTFRTRPLQTRLIHAGPKRPLLTPLRRSNILRRRWDSSNASASQSDANLSLSQRLKKMSKDYGWAALYVYFGLSALDFPFCFLAVKLLGTDTIGHWEHVVVSYVKGLLQWPITGAAQEQQQLGEAAHRVAETIDGVEGRRLLDDAPASAAQPYSVQEHGYKEAEAANKGDNASLWTQLALAYAIHKSFIFIRVPLTAAILPKVVKTLRGWGWNIGPTRKAKAIAGGQGVGVNTKGSGVRPDN